jgi:hypothetical protein
MAQWIPWWSNEPLNGRMNHLMIEEITFWLFQLLETHNLTFWSDFDPAVYQPIHDFQRRGIVVVKKILQMFSSKSLEWTKIMKSERKGKIRIPPLFLQHISHMRYCRHCQTFSNIVKQKRRAWNPNSPEQAHGITKTVSWPLSQVVTFQIMQFIASHHESSFLSDFNLHVFKFDDWPSTKVCWYHS